MSGIFNSQRSHRNTFIIIKIIKNYKQVSALRKLPIQGELLNQCVSFIGNFRCQHPGVIFLSCTSL